MTRLEVDWPSTLAAWDQREQVATDAFGHCQPRASCSHPLLVIDLALALGSDLAHLLPAALYDLSRYGLSKILSGTPRPAALPHPAPVPPRLLHTPAPRANQRSPCPRSSSRPSAGAKLRRPTSPPSSPRTSTRARAPCSAHTSRTSRPRGTRAVSRSTSSC
ncbi:hypothetical protein B0H14DRAFT_1633300 [Mycena olivaceomarginata]|nr:hypothetical protein B0H14DRAFT_1633300 [Mycena olivaceomarginata]